MSAMDARPWPPVEREPYPHHDWCTYGKGFGSAPGCDCGTEEQNDLKEAYWEGYDAAVSARDEVNAELAGRLQRAVMRLEEHRADKAGWSQERARLGGKIEGVQLAASYLEDGARIFGDGATVRCPDYKHEREHPTHWHTIQAGNITIAQGQCPGWSA